MKIWKTRIYTVLALLFILSFWAVAQQGGGITTSIARHIGWGSALPSTCRPQTGDVFFKTTSTIGLYYCSATNTWSSVGSGNNSSAIYAQSFTTQTSVALAHNLGTTNILVACYDTSTPPLAIEWNTLALTNSNTATISFTNPQSGTCSVAGNSVTSANGTVTGGTGGQFAKYLVSGATVSGESWSQASSFSATPTFNLSLGSPIMTMTANVTSITFSNPTTGRPYFIELCQDSMGGRTATAPTGFVAFMTVGASASTCSSQAFHYNGSRYIADSTGVINQ